ncbi:Sec14 domain containing protein [Plasmodium reichenowi]|uniref:Sec14 domain containing protein n=1 Tax=Plasmodium reichenowi TaxID=5854 RepID=A0A151LPM5_PLARE|nr:Sec14 domain containing protein [Plasmodium reichenowi]KYO01144.1 Sec14 domain containing protein [Plasmodium reichenowi]
MELSKGKVIIEKDINEHTIDDEVFMFEPDIDDVYDKNTNLRFIFHNTFITSEEEIAISEFRKYCKSRCLKINKIYFENECLRYLYSAQFDFSKAMELIKSNYEFRLSSILPIKEKDVIFYINKGVMYWHGRDKKCRPILIINLLKVELLSIDDLSNLFFFCFEFFLKYLCIPGKIENYISIIDCSGISISKFPMTTFMKLLEIMNSKYRCRLFRMYILEAPKILKTFGKSFLNFAPTYMTKKLKILDNNYADYLREEILSTQLEKKYGGIQDDKINNFYPFHFYPSCYISQQQKRKTQDNKAVIEKKINIFNNDHIYNIFLSGYSMHVILVPKDQRIIDNHRYSDILINDSNSANLERSACIEGDTSDNHKEDADIVKQNVHEDMVKSMSIDSLKQISSDNLKQISSDNLKQISSDNLKHIGSDNLKHIGSDNLKHTVSDNLKHINSYNFKHISSDHHNNYYHKRKKKKKKKHIILNEEELLLQQQFVNYMKNEEYDIENVHILKNNKFINFKNKYVVHIDSIHKWIFKIKNLFLSNITINYITKRFPFLKNVILVKSNFKCINEYIKYLKENVPPQISTSHQIVSTNNEYNEEDNHKNKSNIIIKNNMNEKEAEIKKERLYNNPSTDKIINKFENIQRLSSCKYVDDMKEEYNNNIKIGHHKHDPNIILKTEKGVNIKKKKKKIEIMENKNKNKNKNKISHDNTSKEYNYPEVNIYNNCESIFDEYIKTSSMDKNKKKGFKEENNDNNNNNTNIDNNDNNIDNNDNNVDNNIENNDNNNMIMVMKKKNGEPENPCGDKANLKKKGIENVKQKHKEVEISEEQGKLKQSSETKGRLKQPHKIKVTDRLFKEREDMEKNEKREYIEKKILSKVTMNFSPCDKETQSKKNKKKKKKEINDVNFISMRKDELSNILSKEYVEKSNINCDNMTCESNTICDNSKSENYIPLDNKTNNNKKSAISIKSIFPKRFDHALSKYKKYSTTSISTRLSRSSYNKFVSDDKNEENNFDNIVINDSYQNKVSFFSQVSLSTGNITNTVDLDTNKNEKKNDVNFKSTIVDNSNKPVNPEVPEKKSRKKLSKIKIIGLQFFNKQSSRR